MEKPRNLSLFDAVEECNSHRLQKEFVQLERMTTSDLPISINYGFSACQFGELLIASTSKGICYMAFFEDKRIAVQEFKVRFPHSTFNPESGEWQRKATVIFKEDWDNMETINLHIQGTDFQFQVWNELLKIPLGRLLTYADIAQRIGRPKAARAVGTAIGSNPVAFIVPCHRVVQKSGKLGGYMWGTERKREIIAWESDKG